MGNVKMFFRDQKLRELYHQNGGSKTSRSVGYDLILPEDIKLRPNEYREINLGIILKPAEGYYVAIHPRSSTFKRFGIIQPGDDGIIDPDYCGKDDYCHLIIYNLSDRFSKIKAGTPVAQLIVKELIPVQVDEDYIPEDNSRGGIGSTDKKGLK